MTETPTDPTARMLRSRAVVTPDGQRPAAVRVRGGRIAEVLDIDAPAQPDETTEDLGDLALLPGLVDTHVHLNEPGRADWEGFAAGTAAAAAGGATTLIDMPLNCEPVTTDAEALGRKQLAAEGKLAVDVGFYGGLVAGNADRMPELIEAGVVGVKAFLCDSGIDTFPPATEDDLRAAMPVLAEAGVPLLVHAELTRDNVPPMRNPRGYFDYLATRPPSFERDAVQLMIRLCEDTGCRTHVVHLADAGCLDTIKDAKDRGRPLTVETCPHYLAFAAEDIPEGFTLAKCAPPIRDEVNRRTLWDALVKGVIDLVASDHSPCPPKLKSLDAGRFDKAWGGISSLQLGLGVVWKMAHEAERPLADVVNWMGAAPAKLVGIEHRHGIAPRRPAHLVVFDPDAVWAPFPDELRSRHPITPYLGMAMRGRVVRTYVHGTPIDDDTTRPGELIRR
ncbi:MAG: allantoinase AllB [Planctomycetota bacterium]